ncbi:MAG: hypothetical protein KDC12_10130 [Flavobacteriales bacterium]|nr:hypothetical protein [Flavobacteriales bacterium]
MKKLLLFIMTLAPFAGIAQGTESGDITFDVGIQAGIYKNNVHQSYPGIIDTTFRDTAGAWLVPINVEYCFHHMLSTGITFQFGSYFTEDKPNIVNENKARVYGVVLDFHPLNKEVFDPYIRMTHGYSTLKVKETDFGFSPAQVTDIKAGGYHFGMDLGVRLYFGKYVGINFFGGYNLYNLNLKELYIDGSLNKDFQQDMQLTGPQFGFALIGRI